VTKGTPTLDVCSKHQNEAYRLFKPRKKHRGPDKKPRRQRRKQFLNTEAEARCVPVVMKLAHKMEKFTGGDVVRATQLTTWNARELIEKMIKDGKLKSTGHGRGKFLSRAT
jgi:hypothetical protein